MDKDTSTQESDIDTEDTTFQTSNKRLITLLLAFGYTPIKIDRQPKLRGEGVHAVYAFDEEADIEIDWEKILTTVQEELGSTVKASDMIACFHKGEDFPLPSQRQLHNADEVWRTNLFR